MTDLDKKLRRKDASSSEDITLTPFGAVSDTFADPGADDSSDSLTSMSLLSIGSIAPEALSPLPDFEDMMYGGRK